MAILPNVPGLKVTINVDGEPLKEYDDDDMNESLPDQAVDLRDKTVSKYIEAVSDQEFTIQLTIGAEYTSTSPSLSFKTYADGSWISTPVMTLSEFWAGRNQTRNIIGLGSYDPILKKGLIHHMKFSEIKTFSDDDGRNTIVDDRKRISMLGSIIIKVFRTTLPVDTPQTHGTHASDAEAKSQVHEKALKGQAKSHGISSSRSSESRQVLASISYIDGGDSPIATFCFHYRSLEALKQLFIIPRTPEPEEPANPPPVSKASDSQRPVKRERDDGENNVKLEPGQSSSKRRKSKYKVTIDLTNESESDADSVVSLN